MNSFWSFDEPAFREYAARNYEMCDICQALVSHVSLCGGVSRDQLVTIDSPTHRVVTFN